jgi:hypothetical protein
MVPPGLSVAQSRRDAETPPPQAGLVPREHGGDGVEAGGAVRVVFDAIRELMAGPPTAKRPIGFRVDKLE